MQLTKIEHIEPGQQTGWLDDGAEGIPVWSVEGKQPGPTLVLTAGVHGCEYVGIIALKTLFEQIRPQELRGRLLMVPLVNAGGFYAGAKQIVPSDGKNVNRVFPAPADGTEAERIAFAVQSQIYPQADFLLDLHGGDVNEAMTPLVFFPAEASAEVSRRAREGAAYLEVGYRIPSTAKNGLYSWAAQCGIPALLMEVGGLGQWTTGQVEMELRSIRSLMGWMGMGGTPCCNKNQKEALDMAYEEAEVSGLWFPRVSAGQTITRGEVLGTMTTLEGRLLQTVRAKWDGLALYNTVSLGVREGDALVACGRFA